MPQSRQVRVRTLHCQPYRGLKPAGSSQNSTLPALQRSQAGRFKSELYTASPTEVSSRQVRVRTRHCQPYRGLKPAGSSQNSTLPALQRSQAGRFESELDTASPTEVSSRQVRVRTRHCQPYRGLKPAGSSQNSTLPALQRSQAGRFESELDTASPTEVSSQQVQVRTLHCQPYRGLKPAGSSQNPTLPALQRSLHCQPYTEVSHWQVQVRTLCCPCYFIFTFISQLF